MGMHGLQGRAAWRTLIGMTAAVAGALALAAATAVAAPATQAYTGQPGGSTPDIERSGLTFFDQAGNPISSGGVAGTLNFTIDGVARVGYCIDTSRVFSTGTEPVDAELQEPPATATNRALAWILINRTPTGAPTPEKASQAAIAQVATWLLVDGQIRKTDPSDDPALNAAAAALVQEALAATATPSSLGLSVTPPAAGATSATVNVTGTPGAVVTLTVVSGPGTLSASQVTIGDGGSATATLTATGTGTVAIAAATAGDGRLTIITPTDPERRPQPTAVAEPTQLDASAQVVFQAAPVTPTPAGPAGSPTPPVVVPVAQTPRLAIAKTAPGRSLVLRPVLYRITVRNPGTVIARNVVLRDRIPGGLSFVKASRASTIRRGTITFRLGNLRPGQSRTVRVYLRANANVRGTRVNTATVSATRVRALRARAATQFRAPVRRIQPAVTG